MRRIHVADRHRMHPLRTTVDHQRGVTAFVAGQTAREVCGGQQ
jgi:hypothetical protein